MAPKAGENFTGFYLLGINGKAADYPSVFVMEQGKVVGVSYDGGTTITAGDLGRVGLGIENQEHRDASYAVSLEIDGQPVNIFFGGVIYSRLEGIRLSQGGIWEEEIGFSPHEPGDNQKAQFFLFIDGEHSAENTLHLWIDVRGS